MTVAQTVHSAHDELKVGLPRELVGSGEARNIRMCEQRCIGENDGRVDGQRHESQKQPSLGRTKPLTDEIEERSIDPTRTTHTPKVIVGREGGVERGFEIVQSLARGGVA
jgi:hypothetical protein